MNDFGHFSVALAWFLALFGFLAGLYAGWRRSEAWYESTVASTIAVAVCTSFALFSLGYSFVVSDFSNQYVWQFSNRDMPFIYKITAIWGGMDGSMLLWCFFLASLSAAVAYRSIEYSRILRPWILAVINSSSLFFLTIVVFVTNPFRYIKAPFIPPDGNGLNPLLQNP